MPLPRRELSRAADRARQLSAMMRAARLAEWVNRLVEAHLLWRASR